MKGKEIKYEWAGEPSGQDADLPRVLRHEKALERRLPTCVDTARILNHYFDSSVSEDCPKRA